MRRPILIILLAFITCFTVYPSAFLHPDTTLPDNNDTRLIAYIIGQVQDNLIHGHPLFYGRFFAPFSNTLAFSDLFLTSAIITLPLRLLTQSPIIIFNLAFIIGSVLTFISLFIFLHYLFKDHLLALTTTLIFFLSGFHLAYLPHLQLFSLWPMLLAIFCFSKYQKENKPLFLDLFFLMVTAQIAESLFPVYLIFFSIVFLSITSHPPLKLRGGLGALFIRLLCFLPIWILLLSPYLTLNATFPEAYRPIRDAAHFSLGLEEVFTSYHSLVFVSVFILSFFFRGRTSIKRSDLLILIFSLLMSFGPVIKLFGHTVKIFGLPIPMPYALFYYLFPGFKGLRTPSRFIILAALAATIILGHRLLPLYKKLQTRTKYLILMTFTLLLVFEAHLPLPGYAVDITPPAVYAKVKNLPATAIILELPVKLWNAPGHEIESLRSLYSLEHGHRRFGGFSGFAPQAWIDLVNKINANGLDRNNLNQLHSLGITNAVENNSLRPL